MTDDAQGRVWHSEAITLSTAQTLHQLSIASILSDFYLAGGTGLALQLGHRISEDLDFFTKDLFDEEALIQRIQRMPAFSVVAKAPSTIHANIQGTKVSFLGYAYPMLYPLARFPEVRIADTGDIACMKISAIASRGTKRDFVDLYVCAQRRDVAELLRLFDRKYARAAYSKIHILKSLTFFEDAEKDPMPHLLTPIDWGEVKRFFLREIPHVP
jgi:Nucleotidyl transferase AbiEii toxin, Type IV TA system